MSRNRIGTVRAILLLACFVALPGAVIGAQAPERSDEPRQLASSLERGVQINGRFFPFPLETRWTESETVERERRLENFESSYGVRASQSRVWRTVGAFAGGGIGFVTYLPYSISESRRASDARRLVELSLVTAGVAYLGYLIGRKLDKR